MSTVRFYNMSQAVWASIAWDCGSGVDMTDVNNAGRHARGPLLWRPCCSAWLCTCAWDPRLIAGLTPAAFTDTFILWPRQVFAHVDWKIHHVLSAPSPGLIQQCFSELGFRCFLRGWFLQQVGISVHLFPPWWAGHLRTSNSRSPATGILPSILELYLKDHLLWHNCELTLVISVCGSNYFSWARHWVYWPRLSHPQFPMQRMLLSCLLTFCHRQVT